MIKEVNVELLFRLWANAANTPQDVAKELGLTRQTVERLRCRYGLPRKEPPRREREAKWVPSPKEIEERAAEVRSRWTPEREYQARCRA